MVNSANNRLFLKPHCLSHQNNVDNVLRGMFPLSCCTMKNCDPTPKSFHRCMTSCRARRMIPYHTSRMIHCYARCIILRHAARMIPRHAGRMIPRHAGRMIPRHAGGMIPRHAGRMILREVLQEQQYLVVKPSLYFFPKVVPSLLCFFDRVWRTLLCVRPRKYVCGYHRTL